MHEFVLGFLQVAIVEVFLSSHEVSAVHVLVGEEDVGLHSGFFALRAI